MTDYILIRSKRRTISITVLPDGSVIVRAPYLCTRRTADAFVAQKEAWIDRTRKKLAEQAKKAEEDVHIAATEKFSEEELAQFKKSARKILIPLVEEYAEIIGVSYGRVTIRAQKTRWGSCSSKGNLNFNCLLVLMSESVQRYVVVHELCHRKYMNHSKAFWSEVEKYHPSYKADRRLLKARGPALISRIG